MPTPTSTFVDEARHPDAMRAYAHKRDTVIRLSTVAVILGAVILVLLLV